MRLEEPILVEDLAPSTPIHERIPTMGECIFSQFGVNIEPVPDGQFHRFATDSSRPGSKDGFYILHQDGDILYGTFGSWRDDVTQAYTSKRNLDFHEARRRDERLKRDRENVRKKQEEAVKNAQSIWDRLGIASSHPYLDKKGITNELGLAKATKDGKSIVLPVYRYKDDGSYYISSLQFIDKNGGKIFNPGCPTQGGFMGIPGTGKTFICEGFATGISINKATGAEVIVAFNCGNLPRVAELFRASKPTVIADNDKSGAGEIWAKKCSCPYILIPEEGMDANDYCSKYGTEKLKELLSPELVQRSWLIDLHEDLKQPKPVKWLIKNWIPEGGFAMIHGQPASGKSFVALDMMLTLSSGLGEWMGFKAKTAKVLYLCGEGFNGLPARINAWLSLHEGMDIGSFYRSSWAISLDSQQEGMFAMNAIRELPFKPDLIVIDTLNRFYSGDENSAQDIRVFLEFISNLQLEFGSAVLVVHHTGVSADSQGRARGSSALRGAVDTEISVANEKRILTLTQKKQKDVELQEPLTMALRRVVLDGWYDEDGDEISSAVATEPNDQEREVANINEEAESVMGLLLEAWLNGKHRYAMDTYPFISKEEIRTSLNERWGKEATDDIAQKGVQMRIKNFLRESGKYKGVRTAIEANLIVSCDLLGESGYRVKDDIYILAFSMAKKEKKL